VTRALAPTRRTSGPPLVACRLGDVELALHPAGVALVPAERLMIVADLHLEKATAFAVRGQMLPPYETVETLRRLTRLVEEYAPERVILLGDSFHSRHHAIEAGSPARHLIDSLGQRSDLVWIAGNHDPEVPLEVPGRMAAEWQVSSLTLRHAPEADGRREIVGHLHPTGRLMTRAGVQRRKCFVLSAGRLLMPAFGALTGGIDVSDPLISRWFAEGDARAFLMCRETLQEVPAAVLR
jgi:DNA ligase-associated metallophosphoesterase